VRARFSNRDVDKDKRCLQEDKLSITGLYIEEGATS
jgi:hypothetical protein